MKKLLSIIILALILAFAVGAETLTSTKVRGGTADPHLFTDGEYYYLAKTGNTRIAVYKADSISGLAHAADSQSIAYCPYYENTVYDPTIEALYGEGATINGTWSPEIHYFSEEDFGAEYAGWYMFVGLRMTPEAGSVYDSEFVRLVVLKATTDDPAGPYGHPTEGIVDYSQPLLDANGEVYDEWACGQSILRIPEGEYAGIYAMWVDEVGRGTNNFYQQIRIARLETPWKLAEQPGTITTPTQEWEYAGSENGKHPKVVEGATAVYGKNGEIFLTYSGSGYWSDYGIGQLTWNGGDPHLTSSWKKYENNPIFTATTAENLRGAGHASFITDTSGNGFFCYHAYTYSISDGKGSSRAAYIEPYSIDYTADNGVGKGLLRLGSGVAANTATDITFDLDGEALATPDIDIFVNSGIAMLQFPVTNADGYILYRAVGDSDFTYLATTDADTLVSDGYVTYFDESIITGNTYTYHAYAYREEEISTEYAEVSFTVESVEVPTVSVELTNEGVLITAYATDNYDRLLVARENADGIMSIIASEESVAKGSTVTMLDEDIEENETYLYTAFGCRGDFASDFADYASITIPKRITPPTITNLKQSLTERVRIEVTAGEDYDGINIYHSADGEIFTLNTRASVQKEISAGGRLSTSVGGLDAGTHYFYATGVASGVESKPSETVSFDVVEVKAPVITVTTTCEAITLTYGGDAEYSAYTIYRLTEGELGYTTEELATTVESTYTLTDITVGEEYLLGVRGTAGGINSAISMAPVQTPAHEEVSVDALAPTCTEDGHNAYAYCTVCGKETPAKETVPAAGHNHVLTEEEIPATYESVGKTAVYTCPACGDSYGGEVIPMLRDAGNGDANGDGKTSLLDIIATLRYICDPTRSIDTAAADTDANSTVDIRDVLLSLQAILNGKV